MGTSSNPPFFSQTRPRAAAPKPLEDNAGNPYPTTLGHYRGKQTGIYSKNPVIFDQESTPPNPKILMLAGALTPDKGAGGDISFGVIPSWKSPSCCLRRSQNRKTVKLVAFPLGRQRQEAARHKHGVLRMETGAERQGRCKGKRL
jgi:hypothetical protein